MKAIVSDRAAAGPGVVHGRTMARGEFDGQTDGQSERIGGIGGFDRAGDHHNAVLMNQPGKMAEYLRFDGAAEG